MPFPANPFPVGLTMKFTKIRLFYHARYAVTRHIRGLTSNAMIIIAREIIKKKPNDLSNEEAKSDVFKSES